MDLLGVQPVVYGFWGGSEQICCLFRSDHQSYSTACSTPVANDSALPPNCDRLLNVKIDNRPDSLCHQCYTLRSSSVSSARMPLKGTGSSLRHPPVAAN